MEPDPDKVVERMLNTPSRCISGVAAVRADSPELWDYCDLVTWQLSCTCGAEAGEFLGFPLSNFIEDYNGDEFVGPLSLRCHKCGSTNQIFDSREHGYHPEAGCGSSKVFGEGAPVAFCCKKCQATSFTVSATFFYWGAAVDLVLDEPEEFSEKAQDLFNEFVAYGRCAKCGELNRFTDFGKL